MVTIIRDLCSADDTMEGGHTAQRSEFPLLTPPIDLKSPVQEPHVPAHSDCVAEQYLRFCGGC